MASEATPTVTMSSEMFNNQYQLIIELSLENSKMRKYIEYLQNPIRTETEEVINEPTPAE